MYDDLRRHMYGVPRRHMYGVLREDDVEVQEFLLTPLKFDMLLAHYN